MLKSKRLRAIALALLVTFLWSTSWILIKQFLHEIPPLTFAGLRYMLASLILLPGLRKHKHALRTLQRADWLRLVGLGVIFYALTQGGQFLTLAHLDAITFSLLLNFSAVLVAVFGMVALNDRTTNQQWAGMAVFLAGVLLYFIPLHDAGGSALGYTLALLTVSANALAAILGRQVNRKGHIPPYVVTVVSMGVGAILLLACGIIFQGLPPMSWSAWLVVFWMALVNTAVAFLLWNVSLQTLSAVESSSINNTMLIQIAILAWIFLGERPSPVDIMGLLLSMVGIFMIQMKRTKTVQSDSL